MVLKQLLEEIASLEEADRSAYLKEVKKIYFNLHQELYCATDEHGYILQNFKLQKKKTKWSLKKIDSTDFINSLATNFSYQYGFSKEVVSEILLSKNKFESYYILGFYDYYKFIYFDLIPKK